LKKSPLRKNQKQKTKNKIKKVGNGKFTLLNNFAFCKKAELPRSGINGAKVETGRNVLKKSKVCKFS